MAVSVGLSAAQDALQVMRGNVGVAALSARKSFRRTWLALQTSSRGLSQPCRKDGVRPRNWVMMVSWDGR